MLTDDVYNHLKDLKTESVVIFGLEAHVCIYQSTKDFLEAKFNVFLASDGIASRFPEDREIALKQLQNFRAIVSTSESIIFELIKDAKNQKFKDLSALIKNRNE
jgi:isochorismate hydrolase